MMKSVVSATLAGAVLTFASPATAKDVTADLAQIAAIMQSEGLQAKLQDDEDGRPFILSGISGYNFVIYAYGCNDEHKDCKFVQFSAAFTPETKPSLADVNKYAAENFFGRFYLDGDNDPVIEFDLDLEAGGMSEALFIDNIAYWDMALAKFGEFAFSKDD